MLSPACDCTSGPRSHRKGGRNVAVLLRIRLWWLSRQLQALRPCAQIKAAKALVRLGSAALPTLLDLLANGDCRARMAAAELLGRIGDKRAIDGWRAALLDRQARVSRRRAADCLEMLGWEPANVS